MLPFIHLSGVSTSSPPPIFSLCTHPSPFPYRSIHPSVLPTSARSAETSYYMQYLGRLH
ncbi:hypothetical protein BC829DRAFT_406862 [Chytridium lagenaria]|nr:hypothetical protein BC829DRAFT_406862 [Chytridium lagenaria]